MTSAKLNASSRRLAHLCLLLGAALLAPVAHAEESYPPPGDDADPFDLSQGTTVLDHNFQHYGDSILSTVPNAFEGSYAPAFAYDAWQGYESYIQFETAAPVLLDGFVLLAAKDGGTLRRSMEQFALYADAECDGTFETTVAQSTVNPDYGLSGYAAPWDPVNGMQAVITLDTPVWAQCWELRVWQGSDEPYWSGVRVFELDAIGEFDSDGVGSTDGNGNCDGSDLVDTDGDGTADDCDLCPADANNVDADEDLVCDADDLCLGDNAAGDADGDQVCEDLDLCTGNDALGDEDLDDYCQDADNCPVDENVDQADADGDGVGDSCEADTDQDGTIDDDDNCPDDYNVTQADTDADAQGDTCDDDDDGDAVADARDNCPLVSNASQADLDHDGGGDACDVDDDADAVLDGADLCPATPASLLVDSTGCSGDQYVDRVCGTDSSVAQYVKCVTGAASSARSSGLITGRERGLIVSTAAKSKR